jgi:hypothetical protein
MDELKTTADRPCSNDAVSFGFRFSLVIRSCIWIALVVLVPQVLLPRCRDLYSEFGVELPKLTQLVFAVGDLVMKFGIVYFIVAIPAIFAWQFFLFFLNRNRIGYKFVVVVDWGAILIATVILVILLGMPMAAIVSGLTG